MDIDFQKIQSQFENLDPENIGSWPLLVRAAIIVGVAAGVLILGFYLDISSMQQRLVSVRSEEQELLDEFTNGQSMAVNLGAYQTQMAEMKESFSTMLRQLPAGTEVAELLVDVTQTGLASGLEFELFEPKDEMPKGFYAELPISLKVVGRYHDFGRFVGGVAALPRIVTLHDVTITSHMNPSAARGRKSDGGQMLVMQATAKTYRYLDETEIASKGKAKVR